MAITVRRLAGHKDLGLTLVAGRENADRVISWAHAIELADPTPYLSGGELVMTTGLKMGPTSDEQYEYVARLSAVGRRGAGLRYRHQFRPCPGRCAVSRRRPRAPDPASARRHTVHRYHPCCHRRTDRRSAPHGSTRRRPAGDIRPRHPARRRTGCGRRTQPSPIGDRGRHRDRRTAARSHRSRYRARHCDHCRGGPKHAAPQRSPPRQSGDCRWCRLLDHSDRARGPNGARVSRGALRGSALGVGSAPRCPRPLTDIDRTRETGQGHRCRTATPHRGHTCSARRTPIHRSRRAPIFRLRSGRRCQSSWY